MDTSNAVAYELEGYYSSQVHLGGSVDGGMDHLPNLVKICRLIKSLSFAPV
jgi:hypothetical protein